MNVVRRIASPVVRPLVRAINAAYGISSAFTPSRLFTTGVNGAWYDPSDITTLYRDAAGTLPVTAVEQPVGLMKDKSGRNNHAFNSSGNSANFPVLSARYNLLTKTEKFDDAVWANNSGAGGGYGTIGTITADSATSPVGTLTADKLSLDGVGQIRRLQKITGTTSQEIIGSVYVKSGGNGESYSLNLSVDAGLFVETSFPSATIDFSTNPPTVTGSAKSYSATLVGAGWYLLKVSATRNSTVSTIGVGSVCDVQAGKFIYIWGADLRVANDALNQPAYQRVNTGTDYDTVGFKPAEVFDGVDDNLIASAGGGSTTAFFWCSAIRVGKVGAVQTLFSDVGTNTGYRVRINASNQLELSAGNGTAYTTVATTATLSIGQRAVLTAWHDGTNLNVQINNGTVHQAAFATATAGTAQFTIGKDNNAASNFFAGRLYEKVYTKDNVPSSAQITSTKTYVANVAGITL